MSRRLFYTDGGTLNNGRKGKQRSVVCVTDGFGDIFIWEEIGDKTNNEAELTAILRCLQENPNPINIISDSQLAVNLINGKWEGKEQRLKKIVQEIKDLNRKFKLIWQSRELNLAGYVIEERMGL